MIEFEALSPQNATIVESWLKDDHEGKVWLSFYADTVTWRSLLDENRHGLIAKNKGVDIGFVDIEVDGSVGYFSFYIAPEFRRKGFSLGLLQALEKKAETLRLSRLQGYFEPGNNASCKALKKAGYEISQQTNAEGMVKATKTISSAG